MKYSSLFQQLHRISTTTLMASVLALASFGGQARAAELPDDLNASKGLSAVSSVAPSGPTGYLESFRDRMQDIWTSKSLHEAFIRMGIFALRVGVDILDKTQKDTMGGRVLSVAARTYADNLCQYLEAQRAGALGEDEYYKAPYFDDLVQNETFVTEALQLTKFSRLAYAPPEALDVLSKIDLAELISLPDLKASEVQSWATKASSMQGSNAVSKTTRDVLGKLAMDLPLAKAYAPAIQEAVHDGWSVTHAFKGISGLTALGQTKESNFGHIFLKKNNDGRHEIVVAVRGTDTTEDVWTDLQSGMVAYGDEGCKIHQGFADSAKIVSAEVAKALGDLKESIGEQAFASAKLRLTGHSLGGALATLTAYELARKHGALMPDDFGITTIGAPVIGNAAFVTSFHEHVTNFVAIAQKLDPVTIVKGHLGFDIYQSLGNVLNVQSNMKDPHGLSGYIRGVEKLVNHEQQSFSDGLKETMLASVLEAPNIGINATRAIISDPIAQERCVRIATDIVKKTLPINQSSIFASIFNNFLQAKKQ